MDPSSLGIDVQKVVRAPTGVCETLAFIGLGSQAARASLVSTVATSVAYAAKCPRHAFTSGSHGSLYNQYGSGGNGGGGGGCKRPSGGRRSIRGGSRYEDV